MRRRVAASVGLGLLVAGVAVAAGGLEVGTPDQPQGAPTREAQSAAWMDLLARVHELDPDQQAAVAEIVAGSEMLGQGNPATTLHPMSRAECAQVISAAGHTWETVWDTEENREICGDRFMAPLYDPATQTPAEATSCMDRLEFPNVPCEYPVVWVRASEAAQLCEAVGKRLCDAHEWEGGCQGELGPADYPFDTVGTLGPAAAQKAMRSPHNRAYRATARWSYGEDFQTGVCAQDSGKTAGCAGGGWKGCGSNTYPAGAFLDCQSPLGVADINGNAAEHMNLPTRPEELASAGTGSLGVTEMKGSWFIWDKYRAHDDWCRWRAPYWHGGKVQAKDSHRNYHLGFRCCKNIDTVDALADPPPPLEGAGSP